MNEWGIYASLLTMGLVSSAHCIGMCGGIMGALTLAVPQTQKMKRALLLLGYNIGRIASYSFMGLLVGLFAEQLSTVGGASFLRVLAGVLLISMGLYLADIWRGLTYLEKAGRYLWVYVQPIGKLFMPVDHLYKALFLGAVWGWLPCGLVYSALGLSMSQASPSVSAGAMLAFGIGTLPSVLLVGAAAQHLSRFLQVRQIKWGLALMMILFGLWTLWWGRPHEHHHAGHDMPAADHSEHGEHMHSMEGHSH